MSIDIDNYEFALEYYLGENTNGEPDDEEGFNNRKEAEDRAKLVNKHGRWKHIFLVRWIANKDDWITIEEWEPED